MTVPEGVADPSYVTLLNENNYRSYQDSGQRHTRLVWRLEQVRLLRSRCLIPVQNKYFQCNKGRFSQRRKGEKGHEGMRNG